MSTELGMPEARQSDRTGIATVLIVEDEESTLQICSDIAMESGLRVRTAATAEQALQQLGQSSINIVITELKSAQRGSLELLSRIREQNPQVSV
ncbi:MAG: response regulator [Candidatus Acidiferrales bacterium]